MRQSAAKPLLCKEERSTTIPLWEYTQVSGNGEPLTGNAEGEDIV